MGVQERIKEIVEGSDVVLFMKGTRTAPQCGFSATVVDILDGYLEEYETVNVLADQDVREGVKAFSEWPTIPQLYVKGKFVGGCDIVKEMGQSGELGSVLGAEPRPLQTPEVTVGDGAIAALAKHWDGEGAPVVRLEIDRQFKPALYFDSPRDEDLVMQSDRFTLLVDRSTARRADGVSIDWVEGENAAGFKIDNPNEPPRLRQLAPDGFRQMRDEGKPMTVFDVRTPEERAEAKIEDSILLDDEGKKHLDALDRKEPVVLYCAHGIRSQAAGEHLLRMGFREVYNLAGGLEAFRRSGD